MRKHVLYACYFLLAIIVLRVFLFEIYAISQSSMKNTYHSGDRVLLLKNFYTLKQNDIVVFRHDKSDIIKRCVGLPGDTLQIRNGVLYSNHVIVENPQRAIIQDSGGEDPIIRSNIYFHYSSNWTLNNFGPYIVPKKGMTLSLTSPDFPLYSQLIKGDSLNLTVEGSTGKIPGQTYVFQKDYVFLVGDNRIVSTDSRVFGPIPVPDIKGKVILKF